jgi:hypothetical protein
MRVWLGEEVQKLLWNAATRSCERASEGFERFPIDAGSGGCAHGVFGRLLSGILFRRLLGVGARRKPKADRRHRRTGYLTRVLDSLDSAFADPDTETAMLDLPHMENRKPEAIKCYLEFRLRQFKMLLIRLRITWS